MLNYAERRMGGPRGELPTTTIWTSTDLMPNAVYLSGLLVRRCIQGNNYS